MSETDGGEQAPTVKRLTAYVPVTAEQLLDAGLPLPDGMEPPPPTPRWSRWRRLRWSVREAVWQWRERVGFWIAGHEPDNDDW